MRTAAGSGAPSGADLGPLKTFTLSLLERVLPAPRGFAVRLWDGTTLPAGEEPPRATLVLREPAALARMLAPPLDLSAGEAYLRGDFEVEGDFEAVIEAVENLDPQFPLLDWTRLAQGVTALRRQAGTGPLLLNAQLRGRRHSRERDRQAIEHHYDVSNAFYKLWLDARMVLRLLPRGDTDPRRGAGGQARASMPQAAPETRRAAP
jgi:cyclopropane-fatty-acyl-phospholipid synthase